MFRMLSLVVLLAVVTVSQAEAGERTYVNPNTGHVYVYVPGQWTRDQAWAVARSRGGYPVIFSSISEWRRVVQGLDYRAIAPAHTGHFQHPNGLEPGLGWMTYTGESSAPLSQLFNSDGPDDGVRNKWGWRSTDEGYEIFYGPSLGKNEDAAVIWHDADGRLEAVSTNHRGGVVIEYGW
jgi:hypothetical protein